MSLADLANRTEPAHTATVWTFDIERFPMITYQWSAKNRSGYTPESMVLQRARISSFAAKRDDGLMVFASEFHHGRDRMLETLYEVLSSADILVGYNSERFDIRHCHTELLLDGYPPPPPVKHIDLLKTIRRRFGFDYNNLGSITKALGLETKLETGGFDLWRRCMDGDPAAWAEYKAYNIQDVNVTDALRKRLGGWLAGHPNMGLWVGGDRVCPICTSDDVHPDGSAAASTLAWRRYRCHQCGAWMKSKHHTARAELTPVAW